MTLFRPILTAALAALLVSPVPALAKPKAKPPAAALPAFEPTDFACVIRMSFLGTMVTAAGKAPGKTAAEIAKADKIAVDARRARSFFMGRISASPAVEDRSAEGKAILAKLLAMPGPQISAEAIACMAKADSEEKAILATMRDKEAATGTPDTAPTDAGK